MMCCYEVTAKNQKQNVNMTKNKNTKHAPPNYYKRINERQLFSCWLFLCQQEDLLSLVVRQLADTLNVNVDRILLQWKTTDLDVTDTPAKLGLSAVDILGKSQENVMMADSCSF